MKPALHKCIAAILFTTHIVFAQADPCKEETQKTEIIYEMCVKFDKESKGYMDCLNMFMEQKAISDEICAAPAVSEECEEERNVAKAIYDSCLEMDSETDGYAECAKVYKERNIRVEKACRRAAIVPAKSKTTAAPLAAVAAAPQPMSLSQALSGSGLSSACVEGFADIFGKSNFDMSNFAKDLVTSVAKVKLQMKSPFGKPKDGDKTSVGLTVGCIKSLPESPAEIQSLLQNIALKAGLSFATDAVASVTVIGDDVPAENGGDKKGVRFGIRVGYNIYNFSFGYKDLNQGLETGGGIGAGLVWNIPIASYLRLNMGLDFSYRQLFNKTYNRIGYTTSGYIADIPMKETALSIPILFQIGKTFYVATGIQGDFPFVGVYVGSANYDGYLFEKNRSSMDFGFVLGSGLMFEHFGMDFKYVYGLTSLFDGFSDNSFYYNNSRYEDKSWLGQYCFGISYFF